MQATFGRRGRSAEFHGSHMGLYIIRLLRDQRYSYIYHPNDIDEFYDHENDPHQLCNLAILRCCTSGLTAKAFPSAGWS
jgi:hypothetical protein